MSEKTKTYLILGVVAIACTSIVYSTKNEPSDGMAGCRHLCAPYGVEVFGGYTYEGYYRPLCVCRTDKDAGHE